LVTVKDLIT